MKSRQEKHNKKDAATSHSKLWRFTAFSLSNAPGTVTDLLVIWLCSTYLFHSYFGQYVLSSILAFESSLLVDFLLFFFIVWRDRIPERNWHGFWSRLLRFQVSATGVYLVRLLIIQILGGFFALPAVFCDLCSMLLSGFLNFAINERVIFGPQSTHRPGVRMLMWLVRPFVKLRVIGKEHIFRQEDSPVVYVCNHGFIYGPIAAILNLPDTFRPWIDSRMLDRRQCYEDLNNTFDQFFRGQSNSRRERSVKKITQMVTNILWDFNPIPVIKGGSRELMNTMTQSLDALLNGNNLLVFPEHSRTSYKGDIQREHDEAAALRTFYSGFAHIGKMYFDRTGKSLSFIPVFINRKQKTLRIDRPINYEPTGDARCDRQSLSMRLYDSLSAMSEMA
ncbi:MAG: GtrA family protein [Bacteroidales bacterium]|nr:GtrA family protein [Bacteroidales bacterium]